MFSTYIVKKWRTSRLRSLQNSQVPARLHATFEHATISQDGPDAFNDMGRKFPRDKTNLAATPDEIVRKVNDYDYSSASREIPIRSTSSRTRGTS